MKNTYNVEIESKFLVTEEDYYRKLNFLVVNNPKLKGTASVLIINHYYDTEDLSLYKKGDTLRVRQKDNHLLLEYKQIKSFDTNKRVCKEFSQPIRSLPKIISDLSAFNIGNKNIKFRYIGNTTSERTNFRLEEINIFFDKNFYLGKLDHEIELEIFEGINIDKYKKLLDLDVNFKNNFKSKYMRFAETYFNWE